MSLQMFMQDSLENEEEKQKSRLVFYNWANMVLKEGPLNRMKDEIVKNY